MVIFKAVTKVWSIYEGLYALQKGLALALWGKGASSLTELGSSYFALEANQTLEEVSRHLGGFPFVQGSSRERPESGQVQGDSENGTDLKITSETDLELKIQAQWVIQVGGGGKKSR